MPLIVLTGGARRLHKLHSRDCERVRDDCRARLRRNLSHGRAGTSFFPVTVNNTMTCARTCDDYRPTRRWIVDCDFRRGPFTSHRGLERERGNFRNRLATIRRRIVRGSFATILAVSARPFAISPRKFSV